VDCAIAALEETSFWLRRHRPFASFWGMRAASTVAYEMQAVALAWQVYHLTGSALALGLIGLAQFVPGIALGLIAGIAFIRAAPAILGAISLDLFAMLLGGTGTIAVALLWMQLFPTLLRVDRLQSLH
jgi:hypothetical protein